MQTLTSQLPVPTYPFEPAEASGGNMYSIEPTGLGTASVTDKPQMGVLQNYAPGKT